MGSADVEIGRPPNADRTGGAADVERPDRLSRQDRFTVPTEHWHELPDGRVQCDVCPRACKLHEGQRGLCFVRGRVEART